jgi:hypothetical protein
MKTIRKYMFDTTDRNKYIHSVDINVPDDSEEYYLMDFQTLIPPPDLKENEIVVWENDNWKILPDFRDASLYYKANGEVGIVSSFGILPEDEGLTEKPKPASYYIWSDKKNDWIISKPLEKEYITETQLSKRNYLLSSLDWIVLRQLEQLASNSTPYLTEDKYKEVLDYKQYLRDLPSTKDWPNIDIKDPPL